VAARLVDVELVIVPLVTVRLVGFSVEIERLVIVALVNVALVDVKYDVEAVSRFAMSAFVVVALLVDAFEVIKLEEEPNNVVMLAEIAESAFANKLDSTLRLEIDDVAAISELELKLVDVPFVTVAFPTVKLLVLVFTDV
jgi:hypothetical protein